MIDSLEIKNFKGISKIKITDLKQFNVIIGKNDVGKSTILESIFAFKAAALDKSNDVKYFPRLLRRIRSQHAKKIQHNYLSDSPTLMLICNDEEGKLTFSIDHTLTSVDVKLTLPNNSREFSLNHEFTQLQNNVAPIIPEGNFDWIESIMLYDNTLSNNMSQLESIFDHENPVDDYDSSIKEIKMINYTATEKRLALRKNNVEITIDDYGEGHKSGLLLTNLLRSRKDSVILIEEIETHQHPESLRGLIKTIIELSAKNNNQVFVTTHSPEILQVFAISDKTKLIHISKQEDNTLVSEITPNNIQMIRDLGWNVGKILNYEKFVLVEGELDKVVFEHSFHKIKDYWPEEVGITIIVAYGIPKQKEILKSMSIPEKSIFVHRDLDDNTQENIETHVVDGFCELTNEGYTKTNEGTKITLTKDSIVKQFDSSKIIITGLPVHFNRFSKHATDDYLLYMIEQDPAILAKINGSQKTLPTLQGTATKDILSTVCGNYGASRALDILNNTEVVNFPTELKDIIEKIEKS